MNMYYMFLHPPTELCSRPRELPCNVVDVSFKSLAQKLRKLKSNKSSIKIEAQLVILESREKKSSKLARSIAHTK
jgi:hypothetical protein